LSQEFRLALGGGLGEKLQEVSILYLQPQDMPLYVAMDYRHDVRRGDVFSGACPPVARQGQGERGDLLGAS
jgi:hypothetical protein